MEETPFTTVEVVKTLLVRSYVVGKGKWLLPTADEPEDVQVKL